MHSRLMRRWRRSRRRGANGYAEKRSGAETDRKALAKLMKEASPGDTVVVTRLDRLARSTRDLLNLLDRLGKDNIGFKSLRETSVIRPRPRAGSWSTSWRAFPSLSANRSTLA